MQNQGRVTACDKDPKRLKLLESNVATVGATNIITRCLDFLDIDPNSEEFRDVDAILLDPSCSGSGTVGLQKSS